MSRRPRVMIPGVPVHVIQRGNNRQRCFFKETDYQLYLQWLEEYAQDSSCDVHAYVLMSNHVHLLLTPHTETSTAILMKHLGQRYAQYINRTHSRSGSLWENRFRSCLTQQENYVLICQKYIELNPVRAGLAGNPESYSWTSYRVHAYGEESSVVRSHTLYRALGKTSDERQTVYREMCEAALDPELAEEIIAVTNGNYVFGDRCFKAKVARQLGRRVTPGKPGRPRKVRQQHSVRK